MIALNRHGRWGRVNRIVPTSIRPVIDGKHHIWTASTGVMSFSEIDIDVPFATRHHLDEELVNTVLGAVNSRNVYTEFYGVTFFQMRGANEWQDAIKDFLQDPSRYEVKHPRQMKTHTPYLFFARRFVTQTTRNHRGN